MMDNEVFLSVVMPMFNSEKTIIKALDSLNNLKDKDIELILIDDGSEDGSYEIAKEYLEGVDFKHIIIKTENRGQSSARNIGIEKAKGEYILLLDSDDYISDDLVSVAKETSKRSNPEILMYDYQRVNEDYTLRENSKQNFAFFGSISPGMDVYEAYKNNDLRIWTSSLIYRTDFIIENNLRFVEEAFAFEDLNFIFKCLWTATKIKVINNVLAYYYQRKDSLTNNVDIKKNMTLVEAIDDLVGVSRKRVLGIDFERVIEREFAVEHIMYQILTALNKENKDDIVVILKDKKIKEYLSEGVKKTPRYGNSLYIWSKIACYAPGLFTFLYIKKAGR